MEQHHPTITPPSLEQVQPPPAGTSDVRRALASTATRPAVSSTRILPKTQPHWLCKRCGDVLDKSSVVADRAAIVNGELFCSRCMTTKPVLRGRKVPIVPIAGLALLGIVSVAFIINRSNASADQQKKLNDTVASVETALSENRYVDAQMTYQQMSTTGDSEIDQRLTSKMRQWETDNFGSLSAEEKTYLNTLLRALPGSTPQGKPRVSAIHLKDGQLEVIAVASPRVDQALPGGMNVRGKDFDSVQKEARKIVALLMQMHGELDGVSLTWSEPVDGELRPAGVFSTDRAHLFGFLNEGLSAERAPTMTGGAAGATP